MKSFIFVLIGFIAVGNPLKLENPQVKGVTFAPPAATGQVIVVDDEIGTERVTIAKITEAHSVVHVRELDRERELHPTVQANGTGTYLLQVNVVHDVLHPFLLEIAETLGTAELIAVTFVHVDASA